MKRSLFKFYSVLCVFLLAAAGLVHAEVIQVESDGDLKSAVDNAAEGDTIVLAEGGAYSPGTINLTQSVTIKAEDNASSKPIVTEAKLRFNGESGVRLLLQGIEFAGNGSNTDYFIRFNSASQISKIEMDDIEIHDYRRCVVRASEDGSALDSLIVTNSYFYNFAASGYRLFWIEGDRTPLKYCKLENSTFYNFTETVLQANSSVMKEVIINNCTVNKKVGSDKNFIFNIDGAVGSSFKFTNNVMTDLVGDSTVFNVGENVADTLKNCRFYFDGTAPDTTNEWSLVEDFVMESPKYRNPSNEDFIVTNSSFRTASTENGMIGDPRWYVSGPAKVGYFTYNKGADMVETASQPDEDPIILMLQKDPNFDVDVQVLEGTETDIDLSVYDVVVVQESFSSTSAILNPGAPLGMANIPVPFVFNKSYTMRDGRGFTNGATGSGTDIKDVFTMEVAPEYQGHELFSGITFQNDTFRVFKQGATDLGALAETNGKGLNYAKDVVVSGENTLLGMMTGGTGTVCVNEIAAGDTIGSEVLQSKMITLGMNFGAICLDYGSNFTQEGLALWRNAVYSAVGFEVPSELPELPVNHAKIAYVNFDTDMDASASQLDNDPIIQMLKLDPKVDVDVMLVAADSVFTLEGYDAVVVQEKFGSGSEIYTPSGSLALEKLDIPFVYNKIYALRNGKAITDGDAAAVGPADENAENEQHYYLEVSEENQSNPLFSGITFDGDSVRMFERGAYDNGAALREEGREYFKALQYGTNIDIVGEGDVALTNTLLAVMKGEDNSATSVCVNDIPAGTRIGEQDTLMARMIAISQNSGAINYGMGSNMTDANLTLWRNAVYVLTGMMVPETVVNNSTMLSELTSTAGTVERANEDTILAYHINVPADSTVIELSAIAESENAMVILPEPINLTNGLDTTVNVIVKAPIGADSSIYKVEIHVATDEEILFVSGSNSSYIPELYSFDKIILESLQEAGYSVTVVSKYKTHEWMQEFSYDNPNPVFDYSPYAAMVISPNTPSSSAWYYKVHEYPIPCLAFQKDCPKHNKWEWTYNDAAVAEELEIIGFEEGTQVDAMKMVVDQYHYVTQDVTGEVMWSYSTPDSTDFDDIRLPSFNILDSIPDAIALTHYKGASEGLYNGWAVPAGSAIGTGTSQNRIVFLGVQTAGMLYPTENFGKMSLRAVEWILGAEDVVESKKVAYVTYDKDMVETASPVSYDPIIRMLDADPLIDLTVLVVDADSAFSIDGYDAIVVQEGFGSGSQLFTPEGSVALEKIKVPFVYNKTYALRDGKAVTSSTSSAGDLEGVLYLGVDAANQSDPLFSGITFDGDSILMFETGAADNGDDSRTKALNYTMDLEMSNANTLLGKTKGAPDNVSICVNDIPAGTVLGTQDTLQARMIALGMNFGAISRDNGTDITAENLTIWRNAVYIAAGLTPQTELVVAADPLNLDATLSGLTASVGTFDQAFDPSVTSYALTIPQGTPVTILNATANDANAIVEGDGNIVTVTGAATATITVTAENGITVKEYTVTISFTNAVNAQEEDAVSVVPTVSAESFQVNAPKESLIEVYDITGQLVTTAIAVSNVTSVDVPQAGIYLIKVGSTIVKVVKVD